MSLLLGCIADDYTGATDLANMLVRSGLRTVQWFGAVLPPDGFSTDAVVIALKSRSIAASDAVAQSLQALRELQRLGARRYFFKYCSTFDSTDSGNIGPVAEALMQALDAQQTVFCPAFPENGRTTYWGHQFVGGQLLNESGMKDHPLTPMTDANLVRVLQRQSKRPVGLLAIDVVDQGPTAILNRATALSKADVRLLIGDAISDEHLRNVARAVIDWPLVTGSSAMGYWLASAFREAEMIGAGRSIPSLPTAVGHSAILAGSCSSATCRQVEAFKRRGPSLALDPQSVLRGAAAETALDWASKRVAAGPVLIYSTMPPDKVRAVQREFGGTPIASAFENTMAEIARGLVKLRVGRLIVAGGETAGAVIHSLGVSGLSIGPEIEPGVPWTESVGDPTLALALKSGNFGSDDFFSKALEMLP